MLRKAPALWGIGAALATAVVVAIATTAPAQFAMHLFSQASCISTVNPIAPSQTGMGAQNFDGTRLSSLAVTLGSGINSTDGLLISTTWDTGDGGTLLTVTDDKGNVYSPAVQSQTDTVHQQAFAVLKGTNLTPGARTFTMNMTVAAAYMAITVEPFSNVLAYDKSNSAAPTTTSTPNSGNVTPAVAKELIWGMAGIIPAATSNVGTGFTAGVFTSSLVTEWKVQAGTGTTAATFSNSGPANTVAFVIAVTPTSTCGGGGGGGGGSFVSNAPYLPAGGTPPTITGGMTFQAATVGYTINQRYLFDPNATPFGSYDTVVGGIAALNTYFNPLYFSAVDHFGNNNEQQAYEHTFTNTAHQWTPGTVGSPGSLNLVATNTNGQYSYGNITSGMIATKAHFQPNSVYPVSNKGIAFQAIMKTDNNPGDFPAFWCYNYGNFTGGPNELDFSEWFISNPGTFWQSNVFQDGTGITTAGDVRGNPYNAPNWNGFGVSPMPNGIDAATAFHKYQMVWNGTQLAMFVDNTMMRLITYNFSSSQPVECFINFALTGSGVNGQSTTSPSGQPTTLGAPFPRQVATQEWETLIAPVAVAESGEGTNIVAPSAAVITDAGGNSWGINGSAQVTQNGTPAGSTANVTQLYYHNHIVYQLNLTGNWYTWAGSGTWNTGTSPTGPFQIGNLVLGVNGHNDTGAGQYGTTTQAQKDTAMKSVLGSNAGTIAYRGVPYGYGGYASDVAQLLADGLVPLVMINAFPNFNTYANETAAYNAGYSDMTAAINAAPAVRAYEITNEVTINNNGSPPYDTCVPNCNLASNWTGQTWYPIIRGYTAGGIAAVHDKSPYAQVIGGGYAGWNGAGLPLAMGTDLANYLGTGRDLRWDATVVHWYQDTPFGGNNGGTDLSNWNGGLNLYTMLNPIGKPLYLSEFGSACNGSTGPNSCNIGATYITQIMAGTLAHKLPSGTEPGVVGLNFYQMFNADFNSWMLDTLTSPSIEGQALHSWVLAHGNPS